MEPDKDLFLLKTISSYCDDILAAIKRFSIDGEKVKNDSGLRALLALSQKSYGIQCKVTSQN